MNTTTKMTQIEYISENRDKFLAELFDLLRLPSVSANPKFKESVFATADFLKEKLVKITNLFLF